MLGWKRWQWAVLATPLVAVGLFLLGAAGWQIHRWGLSWLWGVFAVVLLGWRWLLVRWTRPLSDRVDPLLHQAEATVSPEAAPDGEGNVLPQIQQDFQALVTATRDDPPLWEDWGHFWQRCQDTVSLVARAYYPEVKYPLLNIYVPQAYGLMRGTVDDLDSWMQQLSPMLNQVTVGQAVQAYETYHRLAPSAQRLWRVWNWAQWVINPATAVARTVSQPQNQRAQEQLIGNLGQLLREAALRQLCQQAIALYGQRQVSLPAPDTSTPAPTSASQNTQTLREILASAQPQSALELKPVSVMLVGRTGAGKSSVINTLFEAEQAAVDLLPSTDRVQRYRWQATTGEQLTLWDTPGYGQVDRPEYRETLLAAAGRADLILLITPALDPALDLDRQWLQSLHQTHAPRPTIVVVTQVDRLRPIREWNPPYDWQGGDRPKEVAIREAVAYRQSQLGEECRPVVPLVTWDSNGDRAPWNRGPLSTQLLESLPPAQQQRLARFLRDRDARIQGAARLIDRYTRQMATQQGLTALLKSPVLQFIATLTTGNPGVAYVLAEQIPVERLPIVIGKLQLAYDLFQLLSDTATSDTATRAAPSASEPSRFDLLTLWPLLLKDTAAPPQQQAWAWGHTLVAYWTQDMAANRLGETFERYLNRYGDRP
jgi:predicted GTPase